MPHQLQGLTPSSPSPAFRCSRPRSRLASLSSRSTPFSGLSDNRLLLVPSFAAQHQLAPIPRRSTLCPDRCHLKTITRSSRSTPFSGLSDNRLLLVPSFAAQHQLAPIPRRSTLCPDRCHLKTITRSS